MISGFSIKGFTIWIICAFFFAYEFFLRTSIGSFQASITHDLQLTGLQFTLLSSTLFIAVYGLMQIPIGFITSGIGLKRTLLIGTTLCWASAFGLAASESYYIALTYRFFMGLGASCGFICLLVSVQEWLPNKYSAVFIGLSIFLGTMGPIVAAGPLESLVNHFNANWRQTFTAIGIAGMVISILVFFIVENNYSTRGSYTILNKPKKIKEVFQYLLSNKQPWYIAIYSGAMFFTLEYLSENEGRHILSLKGFSPVDASYMLSSGWIGYAIGCPILGVISDFIEKRKVVIQFSAVIGLFSILGIAYLPTDYTHFCLFLLGFSASGQSIGFALIAEQFKKNYVSIGFALNNAVIFLTLVFGAPLIASSLEGDCLLTSLESYFPAFIIILALALISITLAFFFIDETHCKSKVDFTILK